MAKISAHDEREIKDYVKYNPNSIKSAVGKKKDMARKVKGAFSTSGSRKERVERFTKHIDKGPRGFLGITKK